MNVNLPRFSAVAWLTEQRNEDAREIRRLQRRVAQLKGELVSKEFEIAGLRGELRRAKEFAR